MPKAQPGNKVKVHYRGTFQDGKEFDSSKGRDPLEFVIGEGKVINGIEEAVEGMEAGEKKSVHVPVEKGYGQRDPEMTFEISRQHFPKEIEPKLGMPLQMANEEKKKVHVVITYVDEKLVKLDANHPLAGHDLLFDIELVEIAEVGV